MKFIMKHLVNVIIKKILKYMLKNQKYYLMIYFLLLLKNILKIFQIKEKMKL